MGFAPTMKLMPRQTGQKIKAEEEMFFHI